MFSQKHRNFSAGVLIALSGLVGLTSCRKSEDGQSAQVSSSQAGYIGTTGYFDFFIRTVGEKQFVVASRYSAVGMIEHYPKDVVVGDQHSFKCESYGEAGSHDLKLVTIDGTRYLFAERYSSCEISKLSE